MSKYNSKTIVIDGITFPSKDESKYYEALKIKQAKGLIKCFELQPKYDLIANFEYQGKKLQGISYKPDYIIYHNDDTEECIEIKGFMTEPAELRIKLFKWRYPNIKITILSRNIKYGDEYGFIEYKELKKIQSKNRKMKAETIEIAKKPRVRSKRTK